VIELASTPKGWRAFRAWDVGLHKYLGHYTGFDVPRVAGTANRCLLNATDHASLRFHPGPGRFA